MDSNQPNPQNQPFVTDADQQQQQTTNAPQFDPSCYQNPQPNVQTQFIPDPNQQYDPYAQQQHQFIPQEGYYPPPGQEGYPQGGQNVIYIQPNQPGYYPGMPGNQPYPGMVNQPMPETPMQSNTFVNAVLSQPKSRNPEIFYCVVCQKNMLSRVRYSPGNGTILFSSLCCLGGFVGGVCFIGVPLPLFVDELKDAVHSCPLCGRDAGRNKFLGM